MCVASIVSLSGFGNDYNDRLTDRLSNLIETILNVLEYTLLSSGMVDV